jgi:YD repeat-containing protein
VNCRGCGTEVDDHPSPAAVNQAVDEVLQASIEDAKERGGVCPLCGHSHYVPFYNRETFRTALIIGVCVLCVFLSAMSWYTGLPVRSSLAQEMLARVRQDSAVKSALGTPIRAGLLASGGIKIDETGWSEAKLMIPLKGSKASGMLHVIAGRGDGPWVVSTFEVWVDQQVKPINLLRGRVEVTGDQAYFSIHTQPAVTPIMLDSVATPPESDGSFPVIRFTVDSGAGRAIRLTSALANRKPHFLDQPESTFEVDLRTGTFVLRRTDLFVPDTVPLVFTRTFHTWGEPNWRRDGNHYYAWGTNHPALGAGFTHSYDICPMGTRNPYTFMDLYMADGTFIHLNRISQGTGYADAMYEQTDTSAEFYKARFWWNGTGWTLHFRDGTQYQFPESYNGKNLAQGAPFEMRDPQGRRVQLIRDGRRNLRKLVSPSGRTISLEYNQAGFVNQAKDDEGHILNYSYDSDNRLTSVRDNLGRGFQYRYAADYRDKMLAVEDENGGVLLRNTYDWDGRVSRQLSADGSEYLYRYQLDPQGEVTGTTVTRPDHTSLTVAFRHGVLVSAQ